MDECKPLVGGGSGQTADEAQLSAPPPPLTTHQIAIDRQRERGEAVERDRLWMETGGWKPH